MKEELDDRWIGKMKELLEGYVPEEAAGDWKQVKRRLNRNLSWSAWLLMYLRRPWIYAFIFGAGILVGYLLFNHSGVETNKVVDVKPLGTLENTLEKNAGIYQNPGAVKALTASNLGVNTGHNFEKPASTIVKPSEFKEAADVNIASTQSAPTAELSIKAAIQQGNQVTQPTLIKSDTASQSGIFTNPMTLTQGISKSQADTNPLPAKVISDIPGAKNKNVRKPIDFSAYSLRGEPWKLGLGYEAMAMIKPDTSQGYFRQLSVHFNRQVVPKLWVGTGLSFGRTGLSVTRKFQVRDLSVPDSLGTVKFRDSLVSYQRWQNHLSIPVRATYDIFRNRRFAVPVSVGSTFGWSYNQSQIFANDGIGTSGKGQSPGGFTGFMTADISVGYEVFYLKGLSAVLSAEYRRMVVGPKSFGYNQNLIGGKVVLNLDFDQSKWK